MNSARLLITLDCNRKCKGCCNTYTAIIDEAIHIDSLDALQEVDEIMISGGEPMLYPEYTYDIIRRLWDQGNPNRKIYLYIALWNPMLARMVKEEMVNGIHYTLHTPLLDSDVTGFRLIQEVSKYRGDISFRSYIDPNIDKEVVVNPSAWDRLEIKKWIDSGECELPENNLYILNN